MKVTDTQLHERSEPCSRPARGFRAHLGRPLVHDTCQLTPAPQGAQLKALLNRAQWAPPAVAQKMHLFLHLLLTNLSSVHRRDLNTNLLTLLFCEKRAKTSFGSQRNPLPPDSFPFLKSAWNIWSNKSGVRSPRNWPQEVGFQATYRAYPRK